MTETCDRFELDLNMRHHNALPPTKIAMLDAHLASCPACRELATTLRNVDATLHRHIQDDVGAVDWQLLRARMERQRRNYRLKLWVAPLWLLQLPLVFLLGTGELPPSELLVIGAPANVAIYAAYVWLVGRPTRTLLASARSRTDLLLGHERELRRQQLRARIFGAVNAMLAAACVVPVLLEEEPRLRLYALGCVILFGAWAAYDRWHRLPRLRAALAEVGQ